jgi:cyanosortase A-associated protein
MYWKNIRVPLLAVTFSIGLLVLGRITLFSDLSKPKTNAFIFPETAPLPQWQPSLASPTPLMKESQKILAQKHYRYVQNDLPLDIEMRYFDNFYIADVNLLMQQYLSIKKSSAVVRQQLGVGYYGLGVDQKRAYLSACINPRGGSTFTHAQFRNNRYFNDAQIERLLPVLQGQATLLDMRCIWTHLSIPLRNSSPEDAYQVLEKAWVPWYQWWQSRFPKP